MDGKRAAAWQAPDSLSPRKAGPAGLRIEAYSERGVTGGGDGDIAMPAIYTRALAANEIAARLAKRGLEAPDLGDPALASFWPLDEERGSSVADASGNRRDGQIVNLGTWMIGGPSFDGGSVGRYATGYDPRTDPNREHGLRLASDDLYDCGWEATEVFRVPKNAKSGIYAAWFGFVLEGVPHQYPVTFVVTKAKGAPKAPLALMCSSTTWRTYGGTPFAKNVRTKPATGSPAGRPKIRQIRRRTVFIGITRTASPLINLGCVCLGQWPGRACVIARRALAIRTSCAASDSLTLGRKNRAMISTSSPTSTCPATPGCSTVTRRSSSTATTNIGPQKCTTGWIAI